MKNGIGNGEYAVVTGASSGLGKAIALELASRHVNTILIARRGVREVSRMCIEKGAESVFYETDLTDEAALLDMVRDINGKYRVAVLVNNAGVGGSNIYGKVSVEYLDSIVNLNIRATMLMIHGLLPNLTGCERAYVMNVSSLASLTPTGFKTVYPASKVFVRYLSIGLRNELKGTSVSVSVALPGAMATSPAMEERIRSQGRIGRFLTISPDKAAADFVRGMFRRKAVLVSGAANRLSCILLKFIPERARASIMTGRMANELRCQGLI